MASVSFLMAAAAVTAVAAATGVCAFGGWQRNHMPVSGRTVLITGGSDGMGLSVARQLAGKGAHVVVVARNVAKLEAAVAQLKAAACNPETQRFHYISADVGRAGYATSVIAAVTAWNSGQPPDIVWCIAGVANPGLWLDLPLDIGRSQMDINYWGSAEMAHSILRVWLHGDNNKNNISNGDGVGIDSGTGDCMLNAGDGSGEPRHLVFTASVVALHSIVGYAAYAPAKAALRSLADTLHQELRLYQKQQPRGRSRAGGGVRLHIVYPGTILSPGLLVENKHKPQITRLLEEDDTPQPPDVVARNAIASLEAGRYSITVGWLGHMMRWGALGGSPRDWWLLEAVMQAFMALVWCVVLPVLDWKIFTYAKTNGHPALYSEQQRGMGYGEDSSPALLRSDVLEYRHEVDGGEPAPLK